MADDLSASEDERFRPPPRRVTMPVNGSKRLPSAAIYSSRPYPATPPVPPLVRRGTIQRQSEANRVGAGMALPLSQIAVPYSYTNDRMRVELEDDAEADRHGMVPDRVHDHRPAVDRYVEPHYGPPSHYPAVHDPRSDPLNHYGDVYISHEVPSRPVYDNDSVLYDHSDDDDDESIYSFTPSYVSASHTTSNERESSTDSATPLQTLSNTAAPRSKVKMMHVHESQYTGDACPEGFHSSKLTLLHEPKQLKNTLFRWGHSEQHSMSFSDFSVSVHGDHSAYSQLCGACGLTGNTQDEVLNVPSLTNSEKNGVAKLLQDVKRRCLKIKKTAAGSHQYITPGIRMGVMGSGETYRPPTRSLYWINMPYFQLKEYSSEAQPSTSCPALTLMQADFPLQSRARDMQQVVQRVEGAPADHCFHIAQLWGIVVNESLLMSCSTLSEQTLQGTQIETTTLPPKEFSSEISKARILVSYCSNVLWAIPLQECRTWFAFRVHFWEFWPRNMKFYNHGKLLTAENWPAIVLSARDTGSRVVIEAVLKALPAAPIRGILRPVETTGRPETAAIPQASAASMPDQDVFTNTTAPSQETKGFSVFTWLATDQGASITTAVEAELERLDKFLRHDTRNKDQLSYAACPEATHDEIRSSLLNLSEDKSFRSLDPDSNLRAALDDRIDVFNAAVMIFELFLPLQFSGASVRKFWGALNVLLDRPWPINAEDTSNVSKFTVRQRTANLNILEARRDFRALSRQIQLFQQIMVHAQKSDRTRFDVPPQLFQAWMYLILATIQAAINIETYRSHIDNALSLLQDGLKAILKTFSPFPLLKWSSILPTDLLSHISLKLIDDVSEEHLKITTVYSEYIKTLKNEIDMKPALSHQETIQRLITEIDVIIDVLNQQITVFQEILRYVTPSDQQKPQERNYYAPRELDETHRWRSGIADTRRTEIYRGAMILTRSEVENEIVPNRQTDRYDSQTTRANRQNTRAFSDNGNLRDQNKGPEVSSTDPGGFRELLASDCEKIIAQRLEEFMHFKNQANGLIEENRYRTQTKKDTQEQAIYAFTIVTVIFLPLSTVAGIFGMNTSDIRDVKYSQWLYWATAIPVTAFVILGGLWWMGELGNATLWILNIRGSSGNSGRFARRNARFGDASPLWDPARMNPTIRRR